MAEKTYHVLGLMSGSSLDGLDISFCKYAVKSNAIAHWELLHADTLSFSEMWQSRLVHLPNQSALVYAKTHTYFGHYMGELVNQFLENLPSSLKQNFRLDFIASHGHTIFHYPDKRMTAQIGDGAALAAVTGYSVIADFRTQDIAIGGEGTPLAPAADKYLFEGYDFYLNLGGIANISCNVNGKMIAFDIGGANQVLNGLAHLVNQEYDDEGKLAAQGEIVNELLQEVNLNPYFSKKYPKSLDNQWVVNHLLKKYLEHPAPVKNRLRTAVEQLAQQTVNSVLQVIDNEGLTNKKYKMFATGGGVFNTFLMQRMQALFLEKIDLEMVIPKQEIIQFKEAILMGLLGVLRMENIPNCMASVTGAKRDTIGGAIYK
ncbi:MAG TPA: anhydro-N-acetylmuramic acid kinase [Phaeodactylibacter sp.]|nr:anhydro-N-acetylmuramic acid kinase [Phaeodactylibacter sp.]